MRAQRYAFTALFAALLWPLIMRVADNPLLGILIQLMPLGIIVTIALSLATVAGIWVVDGMSGWSGGTQPLGGTHATMLRLGIGLVAMIVFCIPLRVVMSKLTGSDFTFAHVVASQGLGVFAAVLIAVQIVDILVRTYQKR